MKTTQIARKPILLCTVGLPFSGKSKWAKTQGLPVVSLAANEVLLKKTTSGKQPQKEPEQVKDFTRQMIQSLFASGNAVVILLAENLTGKEREFWQDDTRWHTQYREFKTTELEAIRLAQTSGASKAVIDQIKTKAKAYEFLST